MMRKDKGFTLIELMIVIAIIAIIAAIAIPGLLSSQRAANERNASASLKTLSSAEADFRANDRDGNKVTDFWTGSVSGLFTMTNAIVAGAGGAASATDPPIKLIELSIAGAETTGGAAACAEDNDLTTFTVSAPKSSYWYGILANDLSAGATEQDLTVNTGGLPDMGDVHNHSKFGFVAYPDSLSAGRSVYIINEGNTIWRRPLTATIKPAATSPPGALAYDWPTDADLKTYFSKLD